MSRAATLRTVGDQITTLLTGFALTTAARELVSRFVEAEQQPALPLLLDVLELEAQARHERRITRLRRASRLPPGKTFATLFAPSMRRSAARRPPVRPRQRVHEERALERRPWSARACGRTPCGRLRACGAPALISPATDRPTTLTECDQAVGHTPLLIRNRQK